MANIFFSFISTSKIKSFFLRFGIIIFLSLMISCNRNVEDVIPDAKILAVKDSIIYSDCCFYTAMIHDSLLILTSDCDSFYFHVFNKSTLKLIRTFGMEGKGPAEFSSPFPFKTNSLLSETKTTLDYYNLNKPQVSLININDIVTNKRESDCIKTHIIDKELFMSIELNRIDNHTTAGIDIAKPNGYFYIYDSKTQTKNWIEISKENLKLYSAFPPIFSGSLSTNKKVLIFACKFFDEISFFTPEGKLNKNFIFSNSEKPILEKFTSTIDPSSKIYFGKSYATDSYYYVARINNSIASVNRTKALPSSILVFDWHANLLKNYGMNSIPDCFCVDESTNLIYTVEKMDFSDGMIKLKRYKLNE